MKKFSLVCLLISLLAISWAGEGFAQGKKEMSFSGTHYFSTTPKIFQLEPGRFIQQSEIMGVRVNDSGDGPFHGASVHILLLRYGSKEYTGSRGYETWTDKDGDKVIWELLDTPPGAPRSPGRLVGGTGKYKGWEGTVEYTLQFPKAYPDGTGRGICREYIKLVIPQ